MSPSLEAEKRMVAAAWRAAENAEREAFDLRVQAQEARTMNALKRAHQQASSGDASTAEESAERVRKAAAE
eukprot:4323826-Prorocentrum_lima.AAC.1